MPEIHSSLIAGAVLLLKNIKLGGVNAGEISLFWKDVHHGFVVNTLGIF